MTLLLAILAVLYALSDNKPLGLLLLSLLLVAVVSTRPAR